jgi:hypothetical protein
MRALFLECGWLLQSASSVKARTVKNIFATKSDRDSIFWAPQVDLRNVWPAAAEAIAVYGMAENGSIETICQAKRGPKRPETG